MTQDEFIASRNGEWAELDSLLRQSEGRGLRRTQRTGAFGVGTLGRKEAVARHRSGRPRAIDRRKRIPALNAVHVQPAVTIVIPPCGGLGGMETQQAGLLGYVIERAVAVVSQQR